MHRLCMTEWMAKTQSLFPYGKSPYGKEEGAKKIAFGDSLLP